MKTEYINYLLTIAECGSIYNASKKLYISPQNLRSALNTLERELGVEIFTRDYTGVEVTEKGKQLLGKFTKIQKELTEISDFSKIMNNQYSFPPFNELNIYSTANINNDMMSYFENFRDIYALAGKSIRINLFEVSLEECIQALLKDENALATTPVSSEYNYEIIKNKKLEYRLMRKNPISVLAATSNPIIHKYSAMSYSEVTKYKHVVYSVDKNLSLPYQIIGENHKIDIAYATNNLSLFYDLLSTGNYISLGIKRHNKLLNKKNIIEIPFLNSFSIDSILIYKPEFLKFNINQIIIDYIADMFKYML